MAVVQTWFGQDLQKAVKVNHIDGNLFSHNGNGNSIGVRVYNDGEPVTLTGTVSGYVITSDGSTVPCVGARSGNEATITIPPAAYQPGNAFITIFLTDGSTVTTLCAAQTTVLQARTGSQVSPGSVVTDWTQTINAAMQSVEDAAENLGGIIATPYASLTYPVPLGKYTYYNSNLYRCISPIETSEEFTAAHWIQVKLGDDVSALKSAIDELEEHGVTNLFPYKGTAIYDTASFAYIKDGKYLVSASTSQGGSNFDVFMSNNSFPNGFEAGKTYHITVNNPVEASMELQFRPYVDGYLNNAIYHIGNGSVDIEIPSNATGILIRIAVFSNQTFTNQIMDVFVTDGVTKADIENQISAIETNVDSIVKTTHADILYGKTATESWYIDASTGEGRTLASFYSYVDVAIPYGAEWLFPYDEGRTDYSCRSIVFYNGNGTRITGEGGSATLTASGIRVPVGAAKVSVTFTYVGLSKGTHYLSTEKAGNVVLQSLNDDISVDANQVNALRIPVQLPNRKPTFCFIFDDGTDGDVNTKSLFDAYGFKCGFALVAVDNIPNVDRYLQYQEDGFEILSHSINATAFSDITSTATAETYLKTSKARLENVGFRVNGFVTPATWLLQNQLPLVCKYYQYGYGHLTGAPEGVSSHPFVGLDIRQLDRWSLESKTIEQTMTAIETAISNNKYMIFYGHSYPSTENNMTEANMATILNYLRAKSDNGEIIVGTPNKTINDFYSFRHSDLIDLYNQFNS